MVYFQFACGCGKPHAASNDDSTITTISAGAPPWEQQSHTEPMPRRRLSTEQHVLHYGAPEALPVHPRTQEARISYESSHSSKEDGGSGDDPRVSFPSTGDTFTRPATTSTPAAVGVPLYRAAHRNSGIPSRRPSSPHQASPLLPVRELPVWETIQQEHGGGSGLQQQQQQQQTTTPTVATSSPSTPPQAPPPSLFIAHRSMSDPLATNLTPPRPTTPTTPAIATPRTPSASRMRRAASYDALPPTPHPTPDSLAQQWDLTFVSPSRDRRFSIGYNDHRASFWDVGEVPMLLLAGGAAKSIQLLCARGVAAEIPGRDGAGQNKALLDGLLTYVVGGC